MGAANKQLLFSCAEPPQSMDGLIVGSTGKIQSDLISILESRQAGSKLARFEDWAASRPPQDVEYGMRFLDGCSDSAYARRRCTVIEFPKK
jgi:hypothetical protein